jgi:hypothetical protein
MKKLIAVAAVVLSACGSMKGMSDRDVLSAEVRKTVGVQQIKYNEENPGQLARLTFNVDSVAVAGTEADVTWTETFLTKANASTVVKTKQHFTRTPGGEWLRGDVTELSRSTTAKQAAK